MTEHPIGSLRLLMRHGKGSHDDGDHGNRGSSSGGRPEWKGGPGRFVGDSTYEEAADRVDSGLSRQWNRLVRNPEGDFPESVKAYEAYIGGRGYAMNEELRYPGEDRYPQSARDSAVALEEAIAKAPVTTGDMVVYRGVKSGGGQPTLQSGDRWTDGGFFSTTTSKTQAAEFGDTVYRIGVPKGARAIIGRLDEKEIILQAGSEFRVVRGQDDLDGGPIELDLVL